MTIVSEARDPAPFGTEPIDIVGAGLVHDLGNLIQVATSAIAAVDRHPDMSRIEFAAAIDRAKTSLDRAGTLVRRNIGLVRRRAIAGHESTDISTCLDDVATLVETLGERGLDLALEVAPDLPHARCDPMGLQNAILNLVFNACDAMPGGGRVTIRAQAAPGGRTAAGIEIRVADTGIGMSRATIARAFEPFFTTKSDGLGGIGLPVVRRFVRDADGDISMDSTKGKGTRVTLWLPAVEQPLPDRR